eukprot:CAMPEP_0182445972 /NCGR_PEP_ID=MMETSP1172-20130603/3902_1 /TAXON_ID=708627 /ORGANISM="Timspurckia oligopyrenoides, Strain CCMP3278" /LENGTH=331 /DNA_ID=CAMNT_0024641823 /DNA_START=126 /DNA_END=1118 /DNA_ORIENTATION=-
MKQSISDEVGNVAKALESSTSEKNSQDSGSFEFPFALPKDISPEELGTAIAQLSVGSLAGFTSAIALKRIGKVASFGVGFIFVILQGLSYSGFVHINWRKLERGYEHALDMDGDGQVTSKDLNLLVDRAGSVLKHQLWSGVGFTFGMLQGMGTTSASATKGALIYGVASRLLVQRLALAGGAATIGLPAVFVEVRNRLGIVDKNVVVEREEMFWNVLESVEDKKALNSMRVSVVKELNMVEKKGKDAVKELDEKEEKLEELFKEEESVENGDKKGWSWSLQDRIAVDNLKESIEERKKLVKNLNENELNEVKRKLDAVDRRMQELKSKSWW